MNIFCKAPYSKAKIVLIRSYINLYKPILTTDTLVGKINWNDCESEIKTP